MKAIIIEDETTAFNSLKAVLAQNTVTQIEVIAELESIEESVTLKYSLRLEIWMSFPVSIR